MFFSTEKKKQEERKKNVALFFRYPSVVPSIVRKHTLPFVEDHECIFFEKMLWQKFDNAVLHFLQLLIRQPGTYIHGLLLTELLYVTNLPRTLIFAWLLLLNFMACI